jgi:RNA polymerase sigma factor (TIGR02999 family)
LTSFSEITKLLRLAASGDREAQESLFRLVEGELRRRAHGYLRKERPDPSMQTTVLIHDAFLKLVGDRHIGWHDRAQFYGLAARCMRQTLVDHARCRNAQKHGGGAAPVSLDEVPEPAGQAPVDSIRLLALNEALLKLGAIAPGQARLVELHYFGGWSLKQIAEEILNISYKQTKNRWSLAKAWLYRELNREENDDGA